MKVWDQGGVPHADETLPSVYEKIPPNLPARSQKVWGRAGDATFCLEAVAANERTNVPALPGNLFVRFLHDFIEGWMLAEP